MPLDRQPWVEDQHYRLTPDGCWSWLLKTDGKGYGLTSGPAVAGERRAHRAAYALVHGPVPKGAHVHHRCENKACINVAHLELHTASKHLHLHRAAESVLTWDDVHAIRLCFLQAAATQYELAERYGVGQPTLSDIITNRTWVDPGYEPGRVAVCDECGTKFRAVRSTQRFCCGRHRSVWNMRAARRRF